MKQLQKLAVLFFPLFFLNNCPHFTRGQFLLPDYSTTLLSSQFNYPKQVGSLDIIWRFNHSIHLDLNYFELDGQKGDFILISDQPLTFEDDFMEFNGSASAPGFLSDSIITSQGVLLSWRANKTVEVLTEFGTFIYFHAEPPRTSGSGRDGELGPYLYKGFNITVKDLDDLRTPPPTTTTERTVTSQPENPVYISKFLSCNEPNKALNTDYAVNALFLEEKDKFKIAVAEIASKYCNETSGCGEYLSRDFEEEDINIPGEDGLHYCDPHWEVYETCVEVKFAITRTQGEQGGAYLMPQSRLEDMWTKKRNEFEVRGYCPYNPPEPLGELNTWVWIASMLGLIFVLSILMVLAWFTSSHESKYQRETVSGDLAQEEEPAGMEKSFFDRNNPIYSVIAKITKRNDDSKYLEEGYSKPNGGLESTLTLSSGEGPNATTNKTGSYYEPRTTSNALLKFQQQELTFDEGNGNYNQGFEEEEEEVYRRTGFSDDNVRSRNNFLTISRPNEVNSDTEI